MLLIRCLFYENINTLAQNNKSSVLKRYRMELNRCEIQTPYSQPESKAFLLRWAGSKRKLLATLMEYWTAKELATREAGRYANYIEPFLGSGALFFTAKPKIATIGDTNARLISTFSALKDNPHLIYNHLADYNNTEEHYYATRDQQHNSDDKFKSAARFIYLNRFCFNGLYRTNNTGKFNVPYGGLKSGSLPSLDELSTAATILKTCRILKQDFRNTLLDNANESSFCYIDPPYTKPNKRQRNQYGPNKFDFSDLEDLQQILKILDARGAKFVVSHSDCSEARQILTGWVIRSETVQRTIAANHALRGSSKELLITNN